MGNPFRGGKMKKTVIAILFAALAFTTCWTFKSASTANAEGTRSNVATVESMIADKANLLPAYNHAGAERLVVNENDMTILPWEDGHFWYKSDCDGLNVCFKASTGNDVFFVLRATAEGAPWEASRGYYLHISGASTALYKVPETGAWQTAETMVMQLPSTGNFFDGEYHRVEFIAEDIGETVKVTVRLDGGEAKTYVDDENAFGKENTEIGIVPNTTKNYVIGDPSLIKEEPEYTVTYTTAHMMTENRENLVPSLAETAKLNVDNGEISSWEDGKFAYKGTNAVDINIKVTNDCKEMALSLNAAADGIMWSATGYFLYLNNGAAQLYKVSDTSNWNSEMLATSSVNSIFDEKEHNVKFYAVKDNFGHLQLGYSIDGGETTTAVDKGTIVNETANNFKIVSVNSTVLFKVLTNENEHTYGDPVVTPPSCLENGYSVKTCGVCGYTVKTEGDAALGHDYKDTVTEATCIAGGYTTHTCTRCNDTYTDGETLSLGHDFEEKQEQATCVADGRTYKECSRCHTKKDEEVISALGHDYVTKTTEATCTEDGETHKECSRCHDKTEIETIPALGHNWSETSRTEATKEADGYVEYACSACGETKRETLKYEEPASSDDAGCVARINVVGGVAVVTLFAAGLITKKKKNY